MKVLVVGSGGREHALAWKIAASPLVSALYCAPGNGGTAQLGDNVPIAATDVQELYKFAKQNRIDLTVVGPEAPLAAGLVDRFTAGGLKAYGPGARAARLEASKVFAKQLMRRHTIPTADHRVFTHPRELRAHLQRAELPLVLKADGLAGGKGVFVCHTPEEAEAAVAALMERRVFGTAGEQVVVEEFLAGQEVSVHALTDGRTLAVLEDARDYKRLKTGDEGPNTGGMGAYSPTELLQGGGFAAVEQQVLVPAVHGMRREGCELRGTLYAGLMLTPGGPRVLEFNVRFGDPEAQVLLPRLRSDLVPLLLAVIEGRLEEQQLDWDPRPAVTVVMAAAGYPGEVRRGLPIAGLAEAGALPDVYVFHAGTRLEPGGEVRTDGGRVLAVTALGPSRAAARERAYEAVRRIRFEGAIYRTDIGL
ncbi:MAG: phosphoribosylamine--glycine ligase [Planctomycetota bacterium]|nr:MAG: phosphoribosylamine--glycine ligase [Planctomycetota bacterium]